jgi:putative NADH-flavin reductase
MRLTVFGATGGIGRLVVQQALERGHTVTAVVRGPGRYEVEHPALEIVVVPGLTDPDPLVPALAASDAVISGVGPRGRKDGQVAPTTARAILRAAELAGVTRLVAVSAMPVGPVAADEGWINRRMMLPIMNTLLADVYAALGEMEDEIRDSSAEWTVLRPPKLVNKALTAHYRTCVGGNVARGYSISRADVAHAMLESLADPATVRQPVGIAY